MRYGDGGSAALQFLPLKVPSIFPLYNQRGQILNFCFWFGFLKKFSAQKSTKKVDYKKSSKKTITKKR